MRTKNPHKNLFVLITTEAFKMANETQAKFIRLRFTPVNAEKVGNDLLLTGFYTPEESDVKAVYSPQDAIIDLEQIRTHCKMHGIRTAKDYIRFLEGKYKGERAVIN